jgi:hypothetical protein
MFRSTKNHRELVAANLFGPFFHNIKKEKEEFQPLAWQGGFRSGMFRHCAVRPELTPPEAMSILKIRLLGTLLVQSSHAVARHG